MTTCGPGSPVKVCPASAPRHQRRRRWDEPARSFDRCSPYASAAKFREEPAEVHHWRTRISPAPA